MNSKLCAYLMIATFVTIASSCQKNEEPAAPVTVSTTIGLDPYYTYDSDPTDFYSNDDAILGRVLFYDKRLSIDNSIACASCHKQALGFGDSAVVSTGVNHLTGVRNAIALQNLIHVESPLVPAFLFWDGRETDLTQMVGDPIVNQVEMGQPDVASTAYKLSKLTDYQQLIKAIYNDGRTLDENTFTHALAAFVSKIQTRKSRADADTLTNGDLTSVELAGRTLFFTKYNCGSCHHQVPGLAVRPGNYGDGTDSSAISFVNIGLDRTYTDQGRGAFTGNPDDDGKFLIPDLHNVAVTAPYMHDGRFKTLDEVLEHYSSKIADHPNLDSQLRDSLTQQPRKMNISPDERMQLIAFLKSLTYANALTDPKFSDPFKAE